MFLRVDKRSILTSGGHRLHHLSHHVRVCTGLMFLPMCREKNVWVCNSLESDQPFWETFFFFFNCRTPVSEGVEEESRDRQNFNWAPGLIQLPFKTQQKTNTRRFCSVRFKFMLPGMCTCVLFHSTASMQVCKYTISQVFFSHGYNTGIYSSGQADFLA